MRFQISGSEQAGGNQGSSLSSSCVFISWYNRTGAIYNKISLYLHPAFTVKWERKAPPALHVTLGIALRLNIWLLLCGLGGLWMVKIKLRIQTWLNCKNELWIKMRTFVSLFPNTIEREISSMMSQILCKQHKRHFDFLFLLMMKMPLKFEKRLMLVFNSLNTSVTSACLKS